MFQAWLKLKHAKYFFLKMRCVFTCSNGLTHASRIKLVNSDEIVQITDCVEDGLPANKVAKHGRQRKRQYGSQLCAY